MPETASQLSSLRRLPRWLKVTILMVLVVANVVALGLVLALRTADDFLAAAGTIPEVSDVLDEATGQSLTFLIVGSDSRAGLDDLTNFGPIGGERGDVIILARVDSETSTAQILSIPRDLYVDIPGHGRDRINAAYAFGGASLMVETIKLNLGVSVNHYVEVGFVGFAAMVDALGGIEIAFPYQARDLKSGLAVDAGQQRLDGDMALAYARSRKYEERQDGQWVFVAANDIGRTQRQQEVIRAILSGLSRPSSLAEAGAIVASLAQHVTIDSTLAEAGAAALAWEFKSILTGSLDTATLPTLTDEIDGKSVQLAREPEASQMLLNFRLGLTLSESPLRLQVLNGNGVGGAAAAMSRILEGKGFEVGGIGDAQATDYEVTTVIVPEGSPTGDQVVAALGFGEVAVGDVDNGYDAVVIVGRDTS